MRDTTQLQRMQNMRVDFVANASHELRTPLASIIGFIETLQGSTRRTMSRREAAFSAIMGEQARRMARLVDDLLSLSRIELNAARARRTTQVEMLGIIRMIADTLGPMAKERAVEVAASMTRSADRFSFRAIATSLLRVYSRILIENAIKYAQEWQRRSS